MRRDNAQAILAVLVLVVLIVAAPTRRTDAATQSIGYKLEREVGAQKIVPAGSVAQLTLPTGAQHAEFYLEGEAALVRWNGTDPVDSATGAFKWAVHSRKEENDPYKLLGFRILCDDCTLWVNYFRDRRFGDPVP